MRDSFKNKKDNINNLKDNRKSKIKDNINNNIKDSKNSKIKEDIKNNLKDNRKSKTKEDIKNNLKDNRKSKTKEDIKDSKNSKIKDNINENNKNSYNAGHNPKIKNELARNESEYKEAKENALQRQSGSKPIATAALDKRIYKAADIVIIGAGPAGLMAGICAKRQNASLNVVIIEGNSVAGKKLATTGNGKCNFTNLDQKADYYHSNNPAKALSIIRRFDEKKVIDFFEAIGIPMRERNGYCYPYSEQAKSFRDIFVAEAEHLGVQIIYDCLVNDVVINEQNNDLGASHLIQTDEPDTVNASSLDAHKFRILCNTGELVSDKLIICCGGLSYKAFGCSGLGIDIAKKYGMEVITPRPALCSLISDYDSLKWLEGVRTQANIKIRYGNNIYEESGEIIFNSGGVSGIPVLNGSRFVARALNSGKATSIEIDFAKDFSEERVLEILGQRKRAGIKPEIALKGYINEKIITVFEYNITHGIAANGKKLPQSITLEDAYVDYLKHFVMKLTGVQDIDKAQVTQGGVSLDSLTENLEAVDIPGLYFAGENLDVDGKCGGYNLQWAFSSGYVAGVSAARKCL